MIKKKWDMFAESVSMSLSNIAGNKMRTFLTTLGIIIGVGAIIALMTVVQGATDTMNAQFDAMGLGTLRVSVAGTAIKHGLTDDDLQTILDCEHVAGISPSLNATVTAKRGNVWSDSISVNGNNDEYFRHNPDLLRRGRAIDVLDVENTARVCLVDGDAAKTLFFGEDPVGQTLYLDGFEYTVVGMIDEDENASLFSQILMGGETDGTVYVPYSSAKKLLGTSTVTAVEVYVTDPDDTDAAVDELEAALDGIFMLPGSAAAVRKYVTKHTGAAVIYGVTGGVAEAVIRHCLPDKSKNTLRAVRVSGVRGDGDIRELTLDVEGTELKLAVVNGLVHAKELIADIEAGKKFFHLVEVMTCQGGCVGGAGQPYGLSAAKKARGEGLYSADNAAMFKRAEKNPIVTKMLSDYGGEWCHEHLHVHYEKGQENA